MMLLLSLLEIDQLGLALLRSTYCVLKKDFTLFWQG